MKKLNLILCSFVIIFLFIFNSAKADTFLTGFPLIIDADTIKIGNDKIRLFGIDAPEKKQFCKKPYINLFFFSFEKNILVEKFQLTA
jgi:endonuclease YncB( thermonuclease family)|tara:strand:- start:99 stop:359 length:261 start_codon:yes stop_codon:yes gene_type:complete